jgi:hypothetical protein
LDLLFIFFVTKKELSHIFMRQPLSYRRRAVLAAILESAMAFVMPAENTREEYQDNQNDNNNPFPTASEKAAAISAIAHRNTPFAFGLIHTMRGRCSMTQG